MGRLLPLALVGAGVLAGLVACAQAGSAGSRGTPAVRDPLVGAWRLVSLEQQGADGKVRRCDCAGMFVFSGDGHASVQVMMRDTQPAPPAGAPRYAQGGYEASFGRYTVGKGEHAFTFHVEGALVRSLVGKDLVRPFELSGRRLVVRPSSPDEHWRVTWERYRAEGDMP